MTIRKISIMLSGLSVCTTTYANQEMGMDSIAAASLEEVVVTGHSAMRWLSNLQLGAESVELSKMSLMPMLSA